MNESKQFLTQQTTIYAQNGSSSVMLLEEPEKAIDILEKPVGNLHRLEVQAYRKNQKMSEMVKQPKLSVLKIKNQTNMYFKDYEGKDLGF